MASKLKISLNQLFVIIALTSAAAIALIITGIALSCYPKVEFNEEIIKRQTVIDYTHCKRVGFHETCGSYFYKPEGDSCICFLNNNFVDLRGNLTVHSLLEMSNQEFLNNGNSSAKSFADLISTSNKQCDPYNGEKTANDTCEAIPNEIFQDYLVLTKAETQDSNDSEVSFSKSTRWGPAANHSVNGFQNVISVLMSNNWKYDGPDANIMNMFPPGNYTLTVRFYGNPNIWRRALVISSKSIDVKTTYRSNAFDIVALILGMILLFGSIALLELRYSITGAQRNNGAMNILEERTPNNRISEVLPEEKPLSPLLNNDPIVDPVLNCSTPLDPTKCDANSV